MNSACCTARSAVCPQFVIFPRALGPWALNHRSPRDSCRKRHGRQLVPQLRAQVADGRHSRNEPRSAGVEPSGTPLSSFFNGNPANCKRVLTHTTTAVPGVTCNGVGRYPFGIEAAARFWPGVRRAALLGTSSGPVLAIEGNVAHREAWTIAAAALGEIRVAVLNTIPLDRRHRSKVDYRALAKAVAACKLDR